MHAIILALAATPAPAGVPPWSDIYPPPRPTLYDRFSRCYQRFGMAVSGVGCTYGRRVRKADVPHGYAPAYPWAAHPPIPPAPTPMVDAEEARKPAAPAAGPSAPPG